MLPDFLDLGSTLQIAGGLLLAVALLARSSRQLVAERLAPRRLRLVGLREAIVLRVQVGVGFLDIVAGFACEWVGRHQAPSPDALSAYAWLPIVVLMQLGLLALGWWHASSACRRHVKESLLATRVDLYADPELARELGELWDVDSSPDDTLESYAERVRGAIGLPNASRRSYGPQAGPPEDSDF
jgi:hypothetical protein